MDHKSNYKAIFKKSSTTFFFSSIFFPTDVRSKIFILYAFVRTADNYVDKIPQDIVSFNIFKADLQNAFNGIKSNNYIIDKFVELSNEYFEQQWVWSFMETMESDINYRPFKTFKELEKYIYGSAEVVGLMISRIINLPDLSYEYAKDLGKGFQIINFIRDINEDISLNRTYIPLDELEYFNVDLENERNSSFCSQSFKHLIEFEINRYLDIQKEAEKGFKYIPYKYLVPIKTASNMYKWTALKIMKNPDLIFRHKVKPNKYYVILNSIMNTIRV